MKTLLLATVLVATTSAVAAPDAPATSAPVLPAATAPAVALSPYDELVKTSRAQFEAKDFVGAQKTTEKMLAIAKTPKEKSDAMRRVGQTLDAQEQYDKARQLWQQALPLVKDAPSDLTALNLLIGQSYYKQEKWQSYLDSAVPLLNDFRADEDATKSAFRLQLADAYSKLKQEDKAREQLDLVVENAATPAQLRALAQMTLGQSYQKSEEWDKARQSFEAMSQTPNLAGELKIGQNQGLGEVAQKQNRTDDAAKAFSKERAFLMMKAIDQANAKDLEGAIASYKAVLNAGVPELPVELGVRLQIGNAQEKLQKYEEARAEFQYVIDTAPMRLNATQTRLANPFKIGAYLGLARVDIAEKKFDAAREKLNKALQIPNLPEKSAVLAEDLLKSLPPKP